MECSTVMAHEAELFLSSVSESLGLIDPCLCPQCHLRKSIKRQTQQCSVLLFIRIGGFRLEAYKSMLPHNLDSGGTAISLRTNPECYHPRGVSGNIHKTLRKSCGKAVVSKVTQEGRDKRKVLTIRFLYTARFDSLALDRH